MIYRLMNFDMDEFYSILEDLKERTLALKVPQENSIYTLQKFNIETEELYSIVQVHFATARARKDAIHRLIKNTLDDAYEGRNEAMRRAAGIQLANRYPYGETFVNLFELEAIINSNYYLLEAMVKSIEAKMNAKITNNSLLNMEKDLMPKG